MCIILKKLRSWVFIKDSNRSFYRQASFKIMSLKGKGFKRFADTWALNEF